MPPLPHRLFIDIDTVANMAANRQGRLIGPAKEQLLSIQLPSKRVYSYSYVRELLAFARVVSPENVHRFNASAKGKLAIATAKEEFEKQLREFNPYSDWSHPSLTTRRLLAATLLTDINVVTQWCQSNQLPCRQIDDKYYFDPDELIQHFVWSM